MALSEHLRNDYLEITSNMKLYLVLSKCWVNICRNDLGEGKKIKSCSNKEEIDLTGYFTVCTLVIGQFSSRFQTPL